MHNHQDEHQGRLRHCDSVLISVLLLKLNVAQIWLPFQQRPGIQVHLVQWPLSQVLRSLIHSNQ